MTRTTTLAESVATTLRHAVQHGEFMPGERLIELTLAHELGVSQNTIRDALSQLEQEGWVVKRARHGVFVRTFTRAEADELYALWAAVEALALEWVLKIITRDDIAYLRQIVTRLNQHVLKSDWRGAHESAFAFHEALGQLAADEAHKTQTAELLARLLNQTRLLENLREMVAPRGLYGWQAQGSAYGGLVECIAARDVHASQRLLRNLIIANGDAVTESL